MSVTNHLWTGLKPGAFRKVDAALKKLLANPDAIVSAQESRPAKLPVAVKTPAAADLASERLVRALDRDTRYATSRRGYMMTLGLKQSRYAGWKHEVLAAMITPRGRV